MEFTPLTYGQIEYYSYATSQILMDVFNNYWLWDSFVPSMMPEQQPLAPKTAQSKDQRSIHSHDFSDKVCKLYSKLSTLLHSSKPFVTKKKKSQACKRKGLSKRRSQFTGVTRNSANYQTLIVIEGKKTYVDSFADELLAAVTFDFYSLLLHGDRATTNFTYSAEEVREMLDSFMAAGQKFNPRAFADAQQFKLQLNQ